VEVLRACKGQYRSRTACVVQNSASVYRASSTVDFLRKRVSFRHNFVEVFQYQYYLMYVIIQTAFCVSCV